MDSNLFDLSKHGKQSLVVRPINHSTIGSDDQFKLWCWILNKSDRHFSVKIGKGETVDDLKKMIKDQKKHALAGIDADTLDIWKVSASSWRVSMRISDILEAISTHSFF
jgi:Crinkler effector protein N-terminal domain